MKNQNEIILDTNMVKVQIK